jgi:hypothetical protein
MTKTILILAANPLNTKSLRLDEEVREIDEGLKRAKHRDQFELQQKWATRPKDLRRAVSEIKPSIIHFCGHGEGHKGIVLENDDGNSQLVTGEALAALFALVSDNLQCVVLNACYSEEQAKEIHKHIPYVVGMNDAIGDKAAIVFATAFYDAVGAGENFERAYKTGCVALQLENIPEHLTPILITNPSLTTKPNNHDNAGSIILESPEGTVPLDSHFYVERPPIEQDCYSTIEKPYALIRIKAPRQMGKSSLLTRVLNHAQQQKQRTVWLSFQEADNEVFATLDNLLQWFCAVIADKLELPDRLDEFWKGVLGAKSKASNYFQKYLLQHYASLTLGLDEVDEVFKHETVASEFFALLRAWHEKSKSDATWKNLRLVITHSKEVYIPLNINQSPFNVGSAFELPEFTREQIADLLQRYQLSWSTQDLQGFIDMVDGHPFLVRLGLYEIARQRLSLEQFLQIAPTEQGLYRDHLRRHLLNLQESGLKSVARQVMTTTDPILIDSSDAFKLQSMGLVRWQGNKVQALCQLYRLYFTERL